MESLNKLYWKIYRKMFGVASKAETINIWTNYKYHYKNLRYAERSAYLVRLLNEYSNKNDRIIELGSGIGRNIHYLKESGYDNVFGIELSQSAKEIMDKEYLGISSVWWSTIEDKITDFEDNEFDVVFSMAVLQHISRSSEWVFQEISRITDKILITIEDEVSGGKGSKSYPRNFKEIFESYGMTQMFEEECNRETFSLPNDRYFTTRVFFKEDSVTNYVSAGM